MEFILVSLILLPLAGFSVALILPSDYKWQRINFIFFTLLSLAAAIYSFKFDGLDKFHDIINIPWLSVMQVNFRLGIDYISLSLVLTTTFIFVGSAVAGVGKENIKINTALMLLLEAFLIGVFLASDVLLFYIFWELVMLPVIGLFFINIKDQYRAIYFYLYTIAGSLVMFLGIVYIYFYYGDLASGGGYVDWLEVRALNNNLIWALFAIAFAIKAPLFPFHGWQAGAYQAAPTFLTVILATLLSKMGWYGFYRYSHKLLGEGGEFWQGSILFLSVVGVIYGAMMAWQSKNIKSLFAYSSLSHLNMMIYGIFSDSEVALAGSIFFAIQHSLIMAGIFWIIQFLEGRKGINLTNNFNGLFKVAPVLAGFFIFLSLANIGLPGLSGFVGEFTILSGNFKFYPGLTVVATGGVILAALYQLKIIQRLFFGEVSLINERINYKLGYEMIAILAIIIIAVIIMGIYPSFLFDLFKEIV
ncbi:MAG: NADH-quinone oxidoreductase subunit M [SAR324 cluster bacterium]|nr:NADH-quinone oxidoreductase subunit M [SAR324 cluster bacterium]